MESHSYKQADPSRLSLAMHAEIGDHSMNRSQSKITRGTRCCPPVPLPTLVLHGAASLVWRCAPTLSLMSRCLPSSTSSRCLDQWLWLQSYFPTSSASPRSQSGSPAQVSHAHHPVSFLQGGASACHACLIILKWEHTGELLMYFGTVKC